MPITNPSIAQLQRAIQITEKIEKLEAELKSLLSDNALAPADVVGNGARKSGMSAKGRARIAEAQKARWAKLEGNTEAPQAAVESAPKKKRRKMSPEARARIVAAQKKRWANFRKGK